MSDESESVDHILADCLRRIDAGESFVVQQAAAAHPEMAEELRHYFSMASLLEQAASKLETRLSANEGTLVFAGLSDLEGYDVRGELGRGGMGIVYRAYHRRMQRDVALKILPPVLAADPMRLARFKQEAAAAAKLTAANVLPIFDVIEDQSVPIIVMPFIDGAPLARILQQRRDKAVPAHSWVMFSDRDFVACALRAADQTIEAVAAIHNAGILHRDIKPSNILVDRQGTAWLSDFGVARFMEEHELTGPGVVLGTLGYMSPEQTAAIGDIDVRADLFSLGVTIFEALTQQLPYGKALVRKTAALPRAPSALQPLLSREHDAVLLKAIHPDRGRRYGSVVEFQEDWKRVRAGLLPRAPRITRLRRLTHLLKRNRLVTASLIVALAALLVAGYSLAFLGLTPLQADEQLVRLDTKPPGARVAFVPLDGRTGEPRPDAIIHANATTPLRQRLPPGDYLVVAYLDDGSGRFHEVYRHVPTDEEKQQVSYIYKHLNWTLHDDDSVSWPEVSIPDATVTDDMALLEGKQDFSVEAGGAAPRLLANLPSFYIDTTEVTVRTCDLLGSAPQRDNRLRELNLVDDHAAIVPYDVAVMTAEQLGKRLPTAGEHEFAATGRGESRFPWGDAPPESMGAQPTEFGPVGDVPFDVLPLPRPVYGLCSNVAEMTMSWGRASPRIDAAKYADISTARDDRIVCGGNADTLAGNPGVDAACRDPALRTRVRRTDIQPGMGFRCVRSAAPRLRPADFARTPGDPSGRSEVTAPK